MAKIFKRYLTKCCNCKNMTQMGANVGAFGGNYCNECWTKLIHRKVKKVFQ